MVGSKRVRLFRIGVDLLMADERLWRYAPTLELEKFPNVAFKVGRTHKLSPQPG
jgi:hypothetical protein